MSKSEQIRQQLIKRAGERMGIIDDFSGFRAFLEAVIEEALEEKAKQQNAPAKAPL